MKIVVDIGEEHPVIVDMEPSGTDVFPEGQFGLYVSV